MQSSAFSDRDIIIYVLKEKEEERVGLVLWDDGRFIIYDVLEPSKHYNVDEIKKAYIIGVMAISFVEG